MLPLIDIPDKPDNGQLTAQEFNSMVDTINNAIVEHNKNAAIMDVFMGVADLDGNDESIDFDFNNITVDLTF